MKYGIKQVLCAENEEVSTKEEEFSSKACGVVAKDEEFESKSEFEFLSLSQK